MCTLPCAVCGDDVPVPIGFWFMMKHRRQNPTIICCDTALKVSQSNDIELMDPKRDRHRRRKFVFDEETGDKVYEERITRNSRQYPIRHTATTRTYSRPYPKKI